MSCVGLIWAQSATGVIGRAGDIPWRLPEDMSRFKKLTMGHTVVMGRRTWESLPARVRPLPFGVCRVTGHVPSCVATVAGTLGMVPFYSTGLQVS